jgi:predicted DNA-binding protein
MGSKLTIKLPEELRRRAKARAAMEGTTLSQVIRERLEEFVAGWDALEEAEDIRAVDEIEARITRGEERLKDWSEVDAGKTPNSAGRSPGSASASRKVNAPVISG